MTSFDITPPNIKITSRYHQGKQSEEKSCQVKENEGISIQVKWREIGHVMSCYVMSSKVNLCQVK